jgi:hypothetical protein
LLKLLYPFHPLFGTPLEVFGAAGGERDLVYVRLPNNTTRGVPAWMFDQAICASVKTAERPIIDSGALWRLAQLLDSLRPEVHSAGHEPTTISPQNNHSINPPSGTKPTSSGLGKPTVQGVHSGRNPHQVFAAVAGTAPVRRTQRKKPGRRLP